MKQYNLANFMWLSKCTYMSGLSSIFSKKFLLVGCNDPLILSTTTSVSTLKYGEYDEMLNTPFQRFVVCSSPPAPPVD